MSLHRQVWIVDIPSVHQNMLLIKPLSFITSTLSIVAITLGSQLICIGLGFYFQSRYIEDETTLEINELIRQKLEEEPK